MTASFIAGAFQKMGEYPVNVKLLPNKKSGATNFYAFVDFYDPVSVIHKLNGKYIPDSNPVSYHFGLLVILFGNHKLVQWGYFFEE